MDAFGIRGADRCGPGRSHVRQKRVVRSALIVTAIAVVVADNRQQTRARKRGRKLPGKKRHRLIHEGVVCGVVMHFGGARELRAKIMGQKVACDDDDARVGHGAARAVESQF